jgi:hypothetical protein
MIFVSTLAILRETLGPSSISATLISRNVCTIGVRKKVLFLRVFAKEKP